MFYAVLIFRYGTLTEYRLELPTRGVTKITFSDGGSAESSVAVYTRKMYCTDAKVLYSQMYVRLG